MTGKIKHTAPTLDGGQANVDDDDMKDPTLRCNGAALKRTITSPYPKSYFLQNLYSYLTNHRHVAFDRPIFSQGNVIQHP